MTKIIALYLPQYHPFPENDRWYGKGYTEWVNVAQARPLFKGHNQPNIPADLGFYDLRLKETVVSQIELAKEYGVHCFAYWHYWFGNKHQVMEKPFLRHLADRSLDLSFCLSWANASWQKKMWNSHDSNEIIIKQEYLGEQDYQEHFYEYLPAFKDNRYFRIDGKPLFLIYKPLELATNEFISVWRKLARKEGLGDFYFVGHDFACRNREKIIDIGFDAVYDDNVLNIHHELSSFTKVKLMLERKILKMPTVFQYKDAVQYMTIPEDKEDGVIPVVAPNWDHSPRTGRDSIVFTNPEPKYFEAALRNAVECNKNKPEQHDIVIIKSWNEWGEGNYMEPDRKYGLGYLESLKNVIKGTQREK